jgi:Glycosyl hydrolases family 16
VLSLAFIAERCGGSSEEAAEIVTFEPPEGSLGAGKPATASVRVKNTSAGHRTLWIGYSVRDPTGEWHDAPPSPVELGFGEKSNAQELSTQPLETPGYYDSRVSVWSEEPEDALETQSLTDLEKVSTFRIYSAREDFDGPKLNPGWWEATTRDLGRGELAPENVNLEYGLLSLRLPANTPNGGEIESKDLYGPGFYAARIKVPDAPSSITGFFLYYPPDLESEIDIEIYNDPSGKILFTTYADGEQSHTETMELPFDPTEDFHDYAFFYGEDSVTFYVDGEPMKEYEGGLPGERMKLYVNSWFPVWLDGEEPSADRYTYVDWFEW